MLHKAKQNFDVHYSNGNEGSVVSVNDDFQIQVIIKEHTNPINFNLEDKKMYFINDLHHPIYRGDEISGIGENKYMVVTIPESNGATTKCRIRKMYDKINFVQNDCLYTFDCIVAKGMLYDAGSYVNEKYVFTEEDMIAVAIQYNDITSSLEMFTPVIINDNDYYKIVEIDPCRLKEHDEQRGVIQLVLIKSVACMAYDETEEKAVMRTETLTDYRYNSDPFEVSGILRYAKLKERIYNSKAREILTPHNVLKTGDYIEATFLVNPKVDDSIEKRIYLTQSLIDKRENYDSAFLVDCNAQFNLKQEDGEPFTVYAYFDNNRTQLMSNERNSNIWSDNSKVKCLVQRNPMTEKIGKEIPRVIIDGDGYEVVGVDKLSSEGLISIEFVAAMINPTLDNLDLQIADYYRFDSMEDVTSDEDFEVIYQDRSSWVHLVGNESLLLGENGEYRLYIEPKLLENVNPVIKLISIDFVVTDEDGQIVENGQDFTYSFTDDIFVIKSDNQVALLGTKLYLTANIEFEETKTSFIGDYQTDVSENIVVSVDKKIYVGGW